MIKKFCIFLLIISFILCSGSIERIEDIRESTDLPLSNEEIIQMLEENNAPTDPEKFENFKNSENTIAVFGEVPYKTGADAYDWFVMLQRVAKNIQKDEDFEKYLWDNGGPIAGYGAFKDGYIIIYITPDELENLNGSDIENIKNIVKTYAENEGVNNLPIVFYASTITVIPDIGEAAIEKEDKISIKLFIKNFLSSIRRA